MPQPHAASAQSQPTQEQISTRTFPFLCLLALALAARRFLASLSQECDMHTQTHAQLVHRQAFNVFWRMSILP